MQQGFTYIELVLVLAIISILLTIAYPGYQNRILQTNRVDGQTALLDLAYRMERHYAKHGTYQSATIGTNPKTNVLNEASSAEGFYTLSILQATKQSYVLQATPKNLQLDAQKLIFNSEHL